MGHEAVYKHVATVHVHADIDDYLKRESLTRNLCSIGNLCYRTSAGQDFQVTTSSD